MIDNDINKIINRLNNIITNEDHNHLDVLGSQLVGLIGALDNIEIIYDHYPLLEIIANRGAELKLTTDESRAEQLMVSIREHMADLTKLVRV